MVSKGQLSEENERERTQDFVLSKGFDLHTEVAGAGQLDVLHGSLLYYGQQLRALSIFHPTHTTPTRDSCFGQTCFGPGWHKPPLT